MALAQSELDRIRALPLEQILTAAGLHPDPADRHQWRGPGMRISLGTGTKAGKWYDHEAQRGGGGAIDLAIHVTGATYREAVTWLGGAMDQEQFHPSAPPPTAEAPEPGQRSTPPAPDPEKLPQVRQYLIQRRGLAPELVEWLIHHNRLYADGRGNAVFRYGLGAELDQGAELRGTTAKPFHGYRGIKSAFLLPPKPEAPPVLAVVEGAIDALSYRQLYPGRGVASVAGGCSDDVLRRIARLARDAGWRLIAAFDRDPPGERMAQRLQQAAVAAGLAVERQYAIGKDWNDDLTQRTTAVTEDESQDPNPSFFFPQ